MKVSLGLLESMLQASGLPQAEIAKRVSEAKAAIEAEKAEADSGIDAATGLRIATFAPVQVVVPVRIKGKVNAGDVVLYVTKGSDGTNGRKPVPAKREQRTVRLVLFTTESGDSIAILNKPEKASEGTA